MKLFFLTVLTFVYSFVFAQSGKLKFEEYTLENGLHVILYKDNTLPIVAVNIMYHVGSKNERSDRTGFAHFFEHLMFEGSENIPRGEYLKMITNAGGRGNAYTTFDITDYYETFPSNRLEYALWMESERLLHLKVDSIGVETQRMVVKEERKQRYENKPYGSFQEQIFSHAFKKHPYSWVPIGKVQYIDEATLSEFMDFYHAFYVPQNAVLVIAGDLEMELSKTLVSKYFAEIPKGTSEIYRPHIVEDGCSKEVRDTIYDNIQVPALFLAYHVPPMGGRDYFAVSMLQRLLSEGPSSRLNKSLIDLKQLAMQVGGYQHSLQDTGLFTIYGFPNNGVSIDSLEHAINNEIQKIQITLLSEKEFTKLINQTEDEFYSENSTNEGIASSFAYYYTFFKDANRINTIIDDYMKVTPEDIRRVAQMYFQVKNRVTLHYLPKVQNQE